MVCLGHTYFHNVIIVSLYPTIILFYHEPKGTHYGNIILYQNAIFGKLIVTFKLTKRAILD